MNRLLVSDNELDADGRVRLTGERAAHLREVLGVGPGDRVRAGVVDGPKAEGVVEVVDGEEVLVKLEAEEAIPERPRVDLILALPRPKVLGRMWAVLASLGVGHLALTNAWRVERNYFDTHQLDPATYRPRLLEGLQQAGDTRLPTVSVHKRLVPLLEEGLDVFGDALRIAAHPSAETRMRAALAGVGERRVLLAIGPEGGWIDQELDLFERCGFALVGLGSRVLRSDVATTALLSLVHDALAGA